MTATPCSVHRLPSALFVSLFLVVGACAQASTTAGGPASSAATTRPAGQVSDTGSDPATTVSGPDEADHHEDIGQLSPARRAQLGLAGSAGSVPVLSAQQWSDPHAVASRFVLADTTYTAAEEPAAVNARRAAYATPRLAADLSTSSSGGARLDELRRRQARFAGEVLAITTSQDDGRLAVVQLGAAVTISTNDAGPDRRVRFYQLTLGRDSADGRWLVARVEQS